MTALDEHINRVERYGFNRSLFPLSYNGHQLDILSNDAYIDNDGRLLYDFCLHCQWCQRERNISGRFPANYDRQVEYVVNAKVACFDTFYENECK